MPGKVCYQPPLYSSPREQSSRTQDISVDEEDAVSSKEISRRQKKKIGSNGISTDKRRWKIDHTKNEKFAVPNSANIYKATI